MASQGHNELNLTMRCWNGNIPVPPDQCHACCISNQGIDYAGLTNPCLPQEKILTTCTVPGLRNDWKCKFKFLFPKINLTWQGSGLTTTGCTLCMSNTMHPVVVKFDPCHSEHCIHYKFDNGFYFYGYRGCQISSVVALTPGPNYCQISNTSRTFVGNTIIDHSDVVGASPVGAAPTTYSFST